MDREHNEIGGGRFNHWFDLNRDWFTGTFRKPEIVSDLSEWRPYVQTDHHEMGSTSTLF
jgi:hypothetical protein